MKHYPKIFTFAAALCGVLLFSCSKTSTNDLHDVQLCLNKADASTAMGCVDKISGDSSPIAYSLRCTAIFITQGYGSAASFVTALDHLGSGTSGCGGSCSSTVSAITALTFTAAGVSSADQRTANINAANEAFTQCSQADAKIYTQIASLFKLGTLASMTAYVATGGTAPTETDVKNAISSLDDATVGNLVTVTYTATCQDTENASDSTKEYCAQLKTALDAGSTESQIGSCLKLKLANPAATCP
jgi:hypothetical protein